MFQLEKRLKASLKTRKEEAIYAIRAYLYIGVTNRV